MSIEDKAEELINQLLEENKLKKAQTNKDMSKDNNNNEIDENKNQDELENNKPLKKDPQENKIQNRRRRSTQSDLSSDSDSSSPPHSSDEGDNGSEKRNTKKNYSPKKSIVSTDSALENLMLSQDINIKAFTLMSCVFCIGTTLLSFIGSLLFQRLLTFGYGKDKDNENNSPFEQIKMNPLMIYILLGIMAAFNIGLVIMISMNNDYMLIKLIYSDLKWYFVLTQLSFGSLFLVSLFWETDLWAINVSLSITMLTILILAFYFTEIKEKKNMSTASFVLINIYISVLFSFISYVTLYNLSCILMENLEGHSEYAQISYKIIKVSINAVQTVLSFVLLTYYKDVFYAYTSAYIECAVFIHEDINFINENIALISMAGLLLIGIILTILKYGKKTFGYEEVSIEVSNEKGNK